MSQRLLVLLHGISRHPLRSPKFKLSAVESLSASKEGGWRMRFREEPVTPVYRHWMCEQVGCNGELLSTGEGITRLSTRWKHRCGQVRPRRLGGCYLSAGRRALKGGCDLA